MSAANIDVRTLGTPDQINTWMRDVLARVEDKWGVLILGILSSGPLRYAELGRQLPDTSQRMLTLSLRRLERDGLVVRTVFPSTPPQVEYALSPVGLSLHLQMAQLIGWALEHEDYIRTHRRSYDEARPGGGSGGG
ncbi:helix-turn-helix domain-containing protein [Streptomyces sp. NPDC048290]|uniref:winged helix-turn-helix transcriptional regulator n=1 Tax=Streptomyces sp. NPDC048290 TaxID=3155811 RepID=UPI00344970A0